MPRNFYALALPILLLLLAYFLRILYLGDQPVWYDEIYSIAVARHSLPEIIGWVYRDNHPVLYWLILYPVVHFLGDSEFLVRLPSAWMGTVAVALVYTAGKQMFASPQAGLFAALWLAVSPIHVVYSQEARMYAPLTLFGLASTFFLYRSVFHGGRLNWILFGVTAAATAHSHNYGLFLVMAQGLWLFCLLLWQRQARLIRGAFLSLGVLILLYGPMLPALLIQSQMAVGSTGVANLRSIIGVFEAFGAGFTGFYTPGLTPGWLIQWLALPGVIITTSLALLGLLLSSRDNWPQEKPTLRLSNRWLAFLLGICFLFPILFVYGYSTLSHNAVWQVRGFQIALGCFALLVGVGLASLRPRWLQGGVCLAVIIVAAVNLHPYYFDRYKSTVPDAVQAMEEQIGSTDILFMAPYWNWTSFRYYYRGTAAAIGGREWQDTFQLAGVGTDYADLIDPRSLAIQADVRDPIIPPANLQPDQYDRVWLIGHAATPQRVLDLFGDDLSIMHYDVETKQWRTIVYPKTTPVSDLPIAVKTPALRWDNGLRLLGYTWRSPPVIGQTARLTLFWQAEVGQQQATYLRIQLTNPNGQPALEQVVPTASILYGIPMVSLGIRATFPTTEWPVGSVVVQDINLDIPPNLPPLSYPITIQLMSELYNEPVTIAGEYEATLTNQPVLRPAEPYTPAVVAVQQRRSISFGDQIRLFGYNLPEATPRPGHHLFVWLNWQAEAVPKADYAAQLRLLRNGEIVAETDKKPLSATFPTSLWQTGDLAQGEFSFYLPPHIADGLYDIRIRLVKAETATVVLGKRAWSLRSEEWVLLGQAEVAPWPLEMTPPVMAHQADGLWGNAARLLGYDLDEPPVSSEQLTLTLYWQVEALLDRSYLVFVHLVDENENVVAQADGVPGEWLRPTTTWRKGEIITDVHTLFLPSDTAAGRYRLYVGLYEPEGHRLPVMTTQGDVMPDGRLLLATIPWPGNE
jgi:mannosyltransferase